MMRKSIARTTLAGAAGAFGLLFSVLLAPAAQAGSQVGPTYTGGFLTCPAGQTVHIESHAVGLVYHSWTTGGGPNADYTQQEYFQGLFGINYTDTSERAVTWNIRVKDQPGGQGFYGMGDNRNEAFCG